MRKKKKQVYSYDYVTLVVVVMLITVGIAVQYSSANGNWNPWAVKQFFYATFGMVIVILTAVWRDIKALAYKFYIFTTCLLIVVIVMGETKMGATRWINLGFWRIQPSELAKISTIIALARYISEMNISYKAPVKFFVIPTLIVTIPAALVFVEPHLGNSIILLLSGCSVIFTAGFSLFTIYIMMSMLIPCLPLAWVFLLKQYQKNRIISFLRPEDDPLGAGYNVIQSEIAIGSGGLFGNGFLKGTQTHLGFLPEKHTDFVFTIIGEEFGFIGCSMVIVLYVILAARIIRTFLSTNDKFTRLVVCGVSSAIFGQFIMNAFMTLGLMPVVGVPLPFISYGGSSLVSSMLCIGVICNLSRRLKKPVCPQ